MSDAFLLRAQSICIESRAPRGEGALLARRGAAIRALHFAHRCGAQIGAWAVRRSAARYFSVSVMGRNCWPRKLRNSVKSSCASPLRSSVSHSHVTRLRGSFALLHSKGRGEREMRSEYHARKHLILGGTCRRFGGAISAHAGRE